MSGVTSATVAVILINIVGKGGKYTLFLRNPHKKSLVALNRRIRVAMLLDLLSLPTNLENVY
jgi:hypothetical protein